MNGFIQSLGIQSLQQTAEQVADKVTAMHPALQLLLGLAVCLTAGAVTYVLGLVGDRWLMRNIPSE